VVSVVVAVHEVDTGHLGGARKGGCGGGGEGDDWGHGALAPAIEARGSAVSAARACPLRVATPGAPAHREGRAR
jgi:hypothetical protein